MRRTNWSSPKKNIFAGMLDLRKALSYGNNARLIRLKNEDCDNPIKKPINRDYMNPENYTCSGATLKSANSIESGDYSDGQKYMMTNYTQLFGSREAIQLYAKTGIVTKDNDFGVGTAHLVKRTAMITYLNAKGDNERAKCFELDGDNTHFVEDYYLKSEYSREPKIFKRKLWVVELLDDKESIKIPFMVKALNIILYPLKYVPTRSILRMDEYRNITFRVGGVTSGFAVEFQIPKKFSFK